MPCKAVYGLFILNWTEEIIAFYFFKQYGDTALTIAKSKACDFYKKLIDQIDEIDQNSKCKLSQIWKGLKLLLSV